MRYPGWILFCLGLTSFVVNLGDHEIAAMMWVDNWGAGVGVTIRVGLMAAGGVLVYLSRRGEQAGDASRAEAPEAPLTETQ